MKVLEFIAGCIVGVVLSVLTVTLGILATKRGRRWEP